MDVFQADTHIEGDGGQDGDFPRGVEAFHVGRGIRFGIAQGLGLLQGFLIRHLVFRHAGQHVVRRSVDDAHDAPDLIGCQAVLQRRDDGDAAADGPFELEIDLLPAGDAQELFAEFRNEVFIGCDHVFPVFQCLFDILPGGMDAAHQFYDNLDFGVVDDVVDVVRHREAVFFHDVVFGAGIAEQHLLDLNVAAGPFRYIFPVLVQYDGDAAADRTAAQEADFDGLAHVGPPLRSSPDRSECNSMENGCITPDPALRGV